MNAVTVGVDVHAHNIIDKRERHQCKQSGHDEQHGTHNGDGAVKVAHHVARINHVGHAGQSPHAGFVVGYAVEIGIIGFQIHLELSRNGASAQKVGFEVALQRRVHFARASFLRNVVNQAGVGCLAQFGLGGQHLLIRHAVVQQHFDGKFLAYLPAEVCAYADKQHHGSQ